MLRILVVALVVLVAAMFLLPRGQRGEAPQTRDRVAGAAAARGRAVRRHSGSRNAAARFQGRVHVAVFRLHELPRHLPVDLSMLSQVRADIASRAPRFTPRVLFVSVDPNRDTPERIAAYLNGFDPKFEGVTASDEALAPLLSALGVAVEKHVHGGANYNVVHNSAVYVLDPNAEWIAVSTAPHDPKVLASRLSAHSAAAQWLATARRMTSSAWVWVTQHLIPKNLSSAIVYRATRSRRPWLKRPLTRWFARTYGVDLAEAANADLDSYATFNEFFTRELKVGARPIATAHASLVAPPTAC